MSCAEAEIEKLNYYNMEELSAQVSAVLISFSALDALVVAKKTLLTDAQTNEQKKEDNRLEYAKVATSALQSLCTR